MVTRSEIEVDLLLGVFHSSSEVPSERQTRLRHWSSGLEPGQSPQMR